jgi:pantoate--beta-alanine ligase
MERVDTVSQMRTLSSRFRADGGAISLVPTMGALHAGHEAVIRAAKGAGDRVVVSIFVNPLSFGSNENYGGYPRRLEADLAVCERLEVDAVFAPSAEEMYPKGYSTFVAEEAYSKPLCGISRPTHFRGVTTVTAKLFNIIHPDRVFLGQKDAQHVAVMRKMAADLNYGVSFFVVPTVRESDGLAVAVRNGDLTPPLRHEALAVSASLRRAKEMVDSGVRNSDRLVAEVTHLLGQHNRVRLIYASVVDRDTMEAVREAVPGRSMLSIAAWVNEVRLTDNALL